MEISRQWAMPDSRTFNIKCINSFIMKYFNVGMLSIDPFANQNKIAKITNDLNTEYGTTYNIDALDFLKTFESNSIDFCFYDPPYSLRQISECYKNVGIKTTTEMMQSSWRSNHLAEISRILKVGGYCLSFGWNSSGIGLNNGFELQEILLVCHGGSHNDTICVCEKKIQGRLF